MKLTFYCGIHIINKEENVKVLKYIHIYVYQQRAVVIVGWWRVCSLVDVDQKSERDLRKDLKEVEEWCMQKSREATFQAEGIAHVEPWGWNLFWAASFVYSGSLRDYDGETVRAE